MVSVFLLLSSTSATNSLMDFDADGPGRSMLPRWKSLLRIRK